MTSETNSGSNASTVEDTSWDPSIWNTPQKNPHNPKQCPHCRKDIAHPDDLANNEQIAASGRFEAYRQHRKAHYRWGIDPQTIFRDGDPYLDAYYDSIKIDGETTANPDEEVAGVYDVTIKYEASLQAQVVAADKNQAKDKAKRLRGDKADLRGNVPTARTTHELHGDAHEVRRLTRREIQESADNSDPAHEHSDGDDTDTGVNFAERLPGWPW